MCEKEVTESKKEYARRLKEIENICDTFANNLKDEKDRSIGMSTMMSYLIHIKKIAAGVIES